jgi:hypothetical protein
VRVPSHVLAKMAGVENADSLGAVAELYDPTCRLDVEQPFPVRPLAPSSARRAVEWMAVQRWNSCESAR